MHKIHRILAAGLTAVPLLLAGCGGGGTESVAPEGVQAAALPMSVDEEETGRPLDISILGDGLFVAHDPATGERVYTRWGRLNLDTEGHLVHVEGWRIGGAAADVDASPPGGADMARREQALPPIPWLTSWQASTKVEIAIDTGLSSGRFQQGFSGLGTSTISGWSWWYSSSENGGEIRFSAIDAAGTRRQIRLAFGLASAQGCLEIKATVDGRAAPEQAFGAWHRLCVQSDGTLKPASVKAPPLESADAGTGLEGLKVEFVPASSTTGVFGVQEMRIDGQSAGHLNQLFVEGDGRLRLYYDNGSVVTHGWLVLARPRTTDHFERVGTTGWRCAGSCVTPAMAAPGERLMGSLHTGWLATSY